MAIRRQAILLLLAIFPSMGASYATQNFLVEAPTQQIAQQVGQAAEQYRREKAIEWLGYEMPPWGQPCPITVKITMSGAGGATTFAFDRGQVLSQRMTIEGSLDRLLASVLPHEVTHTVFAFFFRSPVPRWADEGGAVFSEDEIERSRHDQIVRQILNAGRSIPLRRLFALREYPPEVMSLYAEGFSVVHFLVSSSSRTAFLNFVAHGMQYGWDTAVQMHYQYRNVDELEQAWLSHLRSTKRIPQHLLAQNARPQGAASTGQTMVRLTAPPSQPTAELATPVFRGQAPDSDDGWMKPRAQSRQTAAAPGNRIPGYSTVIPNEHWQPATNPNERAPHTPEGASVQLGSPTFPTNPQQAAPKNNAAPTFPTNPQPFPAPTPVAAQPPVQVPQPVPAQTQRSATNSQTRVNPYPVSPIGYPY